MRSAKAEQHCYVIESVDKMHFRVLELRIIFDCAEYQPSRVLGPMRVRCEPGMVYARSASRAISARSSPRASSRCSTAPSTEKRNKATGDGSFIGSRPLQAITGPARGRVRPGNHRCPSRGTGQTLWGPRQALMSPSQPVIGSGVHGAHSPWASRAVMASARPSARTVATQKGVPSP
jgi:hypothetical protein